MVNSNVVTYYLCYLVCFYCVRVSLCGKIKLACFDKVCMYSEFCVFHVRKVVLCVYFFYFFPQTGTLTEDSLDLLGVRPCFNQRYSLVNLCIL